MIRPDYEGGSIVNLMASIVEGLGGAPGDYPPLRALPPQELAQARNVVLLVVDGLGHGKLAGAAAPTLRRHLRCPITSVFPSTTASAITTFLTGQAPQQHAVTGWHMHFREVGTVAAVLPFRVRVGGRLLSTCGVDPRVLLAPSPVFRRIPVASHVVAPARIVDSDFNAAFSAGAQRHGYETPDEFVDRIGWLLEHPQRKYVYAYYPEIDSLAHEYGIASPRVAEHLAAFDRALAQLLERARGTGTTLIVTADHGFVDVTSDAIVELADHPELAATLLLPLCGERRTAYAYVQPHLMRQFEAYVASRLADFMTALPVEEAIAQGWFGRGTPQPRLRERLGSHVLMMKRNCVLMEWLPGEKRYAHIGVHGGASVDEMQVPLVVAAA